MFSDNPLLAQLKQQMVADLPVVEGVVKATEKGFGFIETDKGDSYFVPPPMMKELIHGDRIKARIRSEGEKTQAEPLELVTPMLSRFIGRVQAAKKGFAVVPDHPSIHTAIKLPASNDVELAEGDWVEAELVAHGLRDKRFGARLLSRITDANDAWAPWKITLVRHQAPQTPPQAPDELIDADAAQRADLTHIPFVTIDAATTQDMDDALYCEALADGSYRLWVAIADPSAYIPSDSELDQAAQARGYTQYLPAQIIGMLPAQLAHDLCSLVPQQTRAALVACLTIDAQGRLAADTELQLAQIQSVAKLTYIDVSNWLDNESGSDWQPQAAYADSLRALSELAKIRLTWREQHSLIFPDRPDYKFDVNEQGQVLGIKAEYRQAAHRLVEETMILANCAIALWLQQHAGGGVFNVQPGFDSKKPEQLKALLAEVDGEHAVETLEGFITLRQAVIKQNALHLDARLRQHQGYASISHVAAPHFAMGLPAYATWTSPIRKYGDLLNHRIIKAVLSQQTPQLPDETMAQHLSDCRRKQRMLERDVADWLYAMYLEHALGESFTAEVFDMSRGGLRVRLLENGAVAFMPASLICEQRDRLQIDTERAVILIDGQERIRLGEQIAVTLADVRVPTRSLVVKPRVEQTSPNQGEQHGEQTA